MSRHAAADRLCVGKHLDSLPETSAALAMGEIGYQAAAALCHLREQLGEKWEPANEAQMVGYARQFSVEHFHACCRHARHVADPDGFDKDCAEDFERRSLKVDPMLDGMHSVAGVLDPVTGPFAALWIHSRSGAVPRTRATRASGWPTPLPSCSTTT
jgi:hypothetical protein